MFLKIDDPSITVNGKVYEGIGCPIHFANPSSDVAQKFLSFRQYCRQVTLPFLLQRMFLITLIGS